MTNSKQEPSYEDLMTTVKKMAEALEMLRRWTEEGEEYCWCEMASEDPLVSEHSEGCLLAQEALSEARKAWPSLFEGEE